jgi:cell division protein DivIC
MVLLLQKVVYCKQIYSMATRKKSKKGGYDFNLEKIPRLLRNRYFIIAIIFGIWVAFFDKHNIIQQFKLQRTVLDLEEKRSYYEREIGQVKRDQRELFSSDESLEKFARERYYMKKKNEDVFVIIEE